MRAGRRSIGATCSRLTDEEGIGLVEVLMAVFILAVSLLALASVATSSLISLRDTRDREQATNAASAALEDVRSRDYTSIVHAAGDVDVAALPSGAVPPTSTSVCIDGEQVVTDAVADPVPFEQVAGDADAITVHTFVTYDNVDCSGTGERDLKRVVAIASWQEGARELSVRQETLVTEVDRGLPVPRFELRPQASAISFSHAFLEDPDQADERRCASHQLRNLGAADSYDWELATVSTGDPIAREPSFGAYDAGDWRITAYLEFTDPLPEPRGTDPAPDDARFAFEAGLDRLVSDVRVSSGGVALLTVCYQPDPQVSTGGPFPEDISTEIVIRSRFDERQERTITHDVTVIDQAAPGTPLYLFDRDDSTSHDRRVAQNNGSLIFVPSVMGPLAATGSDPALVNNLSTHGYGAADANWSEDIGAADLPGIRLRPPASSTESREVSATTAAWHYQLQTDTTLLRNATLLLWVAPVDALQGVLGTSVPLELEVRLDGLAKNEKQVAWTGISRLAAYVHSTPLLSLTDGWQLVEIPLDLGGEVELEADQYLRLRVTCGEGSGQDCNLAYDNTAYDSALFVQIR